MDTSLIPRCGTITQTRSPGGSATTSFAPTGARTRALIERSGSTETSRAGVVDREVLDRQVGKALRRRTDYARGRARAGRGGRMPVVLQHESGEPASNGYGDHGQNQPARQPWSGGDEFLVAFGVCRHRDDNRRLVAVHVLVPRVHVASRPV